jgi:hypothetical protein
MRILRVMSSPTTARMRILLKSEIQDMRQNIVFNSRNLNPYKNNTWYYLSAVADYTSYLVQ